MENNHFPFLPEDAWKKKAVEASRREIIARIEREKREKIKNLLFIPSEEELLQSGTKEVIKLISILKPD